MSEHTFPRGTLQDSHEPRVDARDDVTQDPLPEAVHWQPRDNGKQTQGNFFDPLWGAAVKTQEDRALSVNGSTELQPVFGGEMKVEGFRFRLTEVKISPRHSPNQRALPAVLQGGPTGLQMSLPTEIFIES